MKYMIKSATIVVVTMLAATCATANEVYKADLVPLNTAKTGIVASGTATFEVVGKNLKVHIKMKGTPPDMQHWEHFHGYPDGRNATCATMAQDANEDGYVDLEETGAVSGTTMVPFDGRPEKMNIPNDTYPTANAKGEFEYTKLVPLSVLQKKFGETYQGGKIDLDKRVIYVHGVPGSLSVPSTVAGQVGSYNTHVTLPIACGKIERVK